MALTIQLIENLFSRVCEFVYLDRLKDALLQLRELSKHTSVSDYAIECDEIDHNYQLLLSYNFAGKPDPQRDTVYRKMKVSTLELADKTRQQVLSEIGNSTYVLKRQLEKEKESDKEETARRIDTYSFDMEFIRLLNESELSTSGNETGAMPAISPKVFRLMWLTDKYTETDLQLIQAIRTSASLPWHEKCLAVSAISLSLMFCFDKEKFRVLCDFYEDRQPQVWQRAFTGLIAGVMLYNKRLELYPEIGIRFSVLNMDLNFAEDLKNLFLQFLKSFETEKLTREFREEILPDVKKFESKLREKLDLDNIINKEMIEDKNPDWEQIFEDSPDLLNKIEKMSEMQMEGLDLFMGTFAMLKNFDFFREISNWFRPFYKENPDAIKALSADDNKAEFLAGLEDSFYMCNSDKYSFCFNINYLPAGQSKNVIGLFNMEAESMREIRQEDTLLHKPGTDSYIFTQYIQDLYRFYKLYPFRSEFRDIFSLDWNVLNSWLLENTGNSTPMVRTCAEFYFSKEYFAHASGLFLSLLDAGDADQSIIEKVAYCYQRLGKFGQALTYYSQAELFETNRLWNIKKIVYCYRQLGNNEMALKWAIEAESLAPDDVYLQTMLGNCYFDLHDFAKAQEHFFKVEFLSPGNSKVFRPIGWCSFVLQKYDTARSYFTQAMEDHPQASDYLNLGHVELCDGNKSRAIELYLAAIALKEGDYSWFSMVFANDKSYLTGNGLSVFELQLTEDYLRYKSESK